MHLFPVTAMQPSPIAINRWSPLLHAERAQDALQSLREIAEVLRTPTQPGAQPTQDESSIYQLADGAAASAVFFAYMDAAGLMPDARALAFEHLNIAIDGLAHRFMIPALYSGFSGIGWAARHVTQLLGETSDDLTGELDLA